MIWPLVLESRHCIHAQDRLIFDDQDNQLLHDELAGVASSQLLPAVVGAGKSKKLSAAV